LKKKNSEIKEKGREKAAHIGLGESWSHQITNPETERVAKLDGTRRNNLTVSWIRKKEHALWLRKRGRAIKSNGPKREDSFAAIRLRGELNGDWRQRKIAQKE